MAAESTLRSLIDAGRNSKRLDELSSARVVGKIALQIHAAQQKAGHGKAVGPITPLAIRIAESGEATLALSDTAALGYTAPEQLEGSGDRRSDVFSLGTVLWEALTYQRLFDAMNDAAVKAAVNDRPITPPSEINANIPAELSAICMRALSRNPTDRYQSLKAMAVEIEEFLSEAGYADNDDKIAQYLKTGGQSTKQVKTEPQHSSRSPSGVELAAKLAGATPTTTPVGFAAAPSPEEWRDKNPQTPMPPVLPSTAQIRNDKSTIAVSVPPQVKVPTNAAVVEAKHTEAKPAAVIVEEEPPRTRKPTTQPPPVFVSKTETAPGFGGTMRLPADLIAPQPKILEAPPVTVAVAKPADEKLRIETAETRPVEALVPQTNGAARLEAAAPPNIAVPRTAPEHVAPAKVDVGTIPGASVDVAALDAAKVDDRKFEPATSTKMTDPDAPKPALEIVEEPKFLAAAEVPKVESPRAASHSDAAKAAGIVSLPNRDSKPDVLAGWGWGTDKHALVPDGYPLDDAEYDEKPHSSRKTLMYVIGGGLAFALIITIVAFAVGGSKKPTKKDQAKPVAEQQQVAEPPPPPEDLTPRAGSDVAVDPQQAAKAQAENEQAAALAAKEQANKEKADKLAAEQAAKEQAARDQADKLAAEQAAREQAAKDKADRRAAEQAAKEQAAKEKAAKLAADKVARDKAKPPTTTTTLRPKTTTDTKKTVAKIEPPPITTTARVNPEIAYRQGLQAFARGDTTAALASLRQSLAANRNYAPTWRGLGLVFEKMGEKDQARSAYKRYLELVPNAGDVAIIKGRLERLGT